MSSDVPLKLYEGILYKRGKLNKNWKERYFVLSSDLKLRYYESQSLSSESYILGNDKNACGVIDLLKLQLIEVALIDSNEFNLPQYIRVLSNYKKTSATANGKNNENGSINNIRSNIIHLILSSRTYILSANTFNEFKKWLDIFYKYAYRGVIFASYVHKQGKQNRSFKRRYCVLNKYKQIKYFNNHKREILHGCIDLNDIHSFNIYDIENNMAPNNNLLQLNGQKRIWVLCFETKELLTAWCKQFEKLKLTVAKKVGHSFHKQDTTFFPVDSNKDDDDEKTIHSKFAQFRSIRGDTVTQNNEKISTANTIENTYETKEKEQEIRYISDDALDDGKEGVCNEKSADFPIQFKIIVDGIGLYKDIELTEEVFGMSGFGKEELVNGKYINDKIVQISNQLFCSIMELEEIGYITEQAPVYNTINSTKDGTETADPDLQKLPSYFNI